MTRKHYKCIIALIALYLVTINVYNTTNVLNDEENVKEKTIIEKKDYLTVYCKIAEKNIIRYSNGFESKIQDDKMIVLIKTIITI